MHLVQVREAYVYAGSAVLTDEREGVLDLAASQGVVHAAGLVGILTLQVSLDIDASTMSVSTCS